MKMRFAPTAERAIEAGRRPFALEVMSKPAVRPGSCSASRKVGSGSRASGTTIFLQGKCGALVSDELDHASYPTSLMRDGWHCTGQIFVLQYKIFKITNSEAMCMK